AAIFALNPNLLYLQTTAMTEPLYLALFIWAVAYLIEFARSPRDNTPALLRCGVMLFLATLTRYDGWFAEAVVVPIATTVAVLPRRSVAPGFSRRIRT